MSYPAACGILPICKKNNKLYLFCGIDHKGFVSDLGGKIEEGETVKQCAAREFHEESIGLLMPYDILMKSYVYKRLRIGQDKYYVSLVIKTRCKNVENRYKQLLDYVCKHNCKQDDSLDFKTYRIQKLYRDKVYPYGYFEFEQLKWIALKDLKEGDYKLRNRFKLLLRKL